jgi:hypothetical protein
MILAVEIVGTARSIASQGAGEFAARSDLRSFLTAADMMASGNAEALYDLDAQLEWQRRRFPEVTDLTALLVFASPPFLAPALEPFASGSTPRAFWIAIAINGVLLVANLALLALLLGRHPPSVQVTLLVAAASFLPMWTALWQGQLSLVLLLGAVCCGLAFRGGYDFLAGLSLSVLLCKPHLLSVPLLFLLLQRRGRALLGAAVGIGIASLLSVLAVGTDGVLAWLALGRELLEGGDLYGIHPRSMCTLRSLLHLTAKTDALGPVLVPWIIGSLLVLAASTWLWRGPLSGARFRLALGTSFVLALVLGPHGYPHDLVLAVPAALGLAAAAIEDQSNGPARWGLAASALLWLTPWVAGASLPPPTTAAVLLLLSGLGLWAATRLARCSMVRGDEEFRTAAS